MTKRSMSPRSRKAKGRRLQDWVKEQLYKRFPLLQDGDIRGAIMGETGADVKFSPEAAKHIPLKIECKYQEIYKGIYNTYEQASNHEGSGQPIIFIKMNRKKPLVILDALYLLDIIKGIKNDGR